MIGVGPPDTFIYPRRNRLEMPGTAPELLHSGETTPITLSVALVRISNACMKCAACGWLEIQDAKNHHFGTIAQLCRAISSELRHVSTMGKNLLNSNTSSTCPRNMVNFGLLTAEICWRVWGTPANFNGFRVLAALLHGNLVVGVSQTLRR